MEAQSVVLAGLWALWATYANDIQEAVIKQLGKKASQKAKAAAEAAWNRVDWKLSAQNTSRGFRKCMERSGY